MFGGNAFGWAYFGQPYAGSTGNPPVNTVAPVISGTAVLGATLTGTNGTWTGDAVINFTYQWQRDGSSIGGETANTHVVVGADQGHTLTLAVTGTNGAGNSTALSNGITIPGGGSGGAPRLDSPLPDIRRDDREIAEILGVLAGAGVI